MSRRNQGPRLRWLDKRGCFYIVWTERGRSRQRSAGTTDREQAQIKLAEFLRQRDPHRGPRDPAEVLVTDVLNDYARERGPKVMAPDVMGQSIFALVGFWESMTVADVTPQACEDYQRKRDRAKGTMRRELGVLRAAINWAHKNGRLARVVAVTLPEAGPARERWLTRAEAASLIRAARTQKARLYLPLFVLMGLYTGRRKEALLSLRWSQVDLASGLIDFEIPGRARTKKRRGRVRIPARLLPHLRRARRRGADLGYVLHINGGRIKNLKKGFAAACRRAGLTGVVPHTLRHTAATWIMQSGAPIWEAAGFLAMRPETLERVYGHHHPDWMAGAADAIGRRPGSVRGMSA
jgi:integrase